MIYLALPFGSTFGWGILGKEVILALSRLADVRLLYPPTVHQQIDDEFDFIQLRRLIASPAENLRQFGGAPDPTVPVIQAAIGPTFRALAPSFASVRRPCFIQSDFVRRSFMTDHTNVY